MFVRWIAAVLHLLALGMGLGAVWARGLALRGPLDAAGLRRVFYADSVWGIAALLWISTGLWRFIGGLEKSTMYYVENNLFRAKMGMLVLILALEIWPMATLIQWRIRTSRGTTIDTQRAATFARISFAQAALVVAMVVAATGMARGFGLPTAK